MRTDEDRLSDFIDSYCTFLDAIAAAKGIEWDEMNQQYRSRLELPQVRNKRTIATD